MAFNHGSKAYFELDDSGGSLTDISTYVNSVDFNGMADEADVSTFGDTFKQVVLGLSDATISLGGNYDPTVDAILASALGNVATKSWVYGPAGSTTGLTKYNGECRCTAYKINTPISGAATWTATLHVNDGFTHGTF